jgi:AraC-like DNA-binding protein
VLLDGGPGAVADNIYALSGSAALLLTFVEPFQRHGCVLSAAERRFRFVFVAVFALLVGASVLSAWAAPEPVETACAVVGLVTGMAAAAFRLRHPLAIPQDAPYPARSPKLRKPPTGEDTALAERLSRLLEHEAIHTEPDLRIADVAARLHEPEYRISRSIVAGLGFANFNRWINHHRIAQARRLLSAADHQGSILEIALDCGFASIGPFNRAFKAETGMTPRDYRAAVRAAGEPA